MKSANLIAGNPEQAKAVYTVCYDTYAALHFNSVSDSDYIQFFPNKALKEQEKMIALSEHCFPSECTKVVEVVRSLEFYPSDQRAFPYDSGVAALHKSRFCFWLSRIHTPRDTVFQTENIDLLCGGALTLAAQCSANANQNSYT